MVHLSGFTGAVETRIVTDSNAMLPEDLRARFDITVVPLTVVVDGRVTTIDEAATAMLDLVARQPGPLRVGVGDADAPEAATALRAALAALHNVEETVRYSSVPRWPPTPAPEPSAPSSIRSTWPPGPTRWNRASADGLNGHRSTSIDPLSREGPASVAARAGHGRPHDEVSRYRSCHVRPSSVER